MISFTSQGLSIQMRERVPSDLHDKEETPEVLPEKYFSPHYSEPLLHSSVHQEECLLPENKNKKEKGGEEKKAKGSPSSKRSPSALEIIHTTEPLLSFPSSFWPTKTITTSPQEDQKGEMAVENGKWKRNEGRKEVPPFLISSPLFFYPFFSRNNAALEELHPLQKPLEGKEFVYQKKEAQLATRSASLPLPFTPPPHEVKLETDLEETRGESSVGRAFSISFCDTREPTTEPQDFLEMEGNTQERQELPPRRSFSTVPHVSPTFSLSLVPDPSPSISKEEGTLPTTPTTTIASSSSCPPPPPPPHLPWLYHMVLAWKDAAAHHPSGLSVGCVVFAPKRLHGGEGVGQERSRSPTTAAASVGFPPPTLSPFTPSKTRRTGTPLTPAYHYSLAEITGVQSEERTVTVTFLFSSQGVEEETVSLFDVIPTDPAVWREVEGVRYPRRMGRETQRTKEKGKKEEDPPALPFSSLPIPSDTEKEMAEGSNQGSLLHRPPFHSSPSSFDPRHLAERLLRLPPEAGPLPEEALREVVQASASAGRVGEFSAPHLSWSDGEDTSSRISPSSSAWSSLFPPPLIHWLQKLYCLDDQTETNHEGKQDSQEVFTALPKKDEKEKEEEEEEAKKNFCSPPFPCIKREREEENEKVPMNSSRVFSFFIPSGPSSTVHLKTSRYAAAFRDIDAALSREHDDGSTKRTQKPTSTLCVFDSVSLLERFHCFMSVRGHLVMPWLDAFSPSTAHQNVEEEEEEEEVREEVSRWMVPKESLAGFNCPSTDSETVGVRHSGRREREYHDIPLSSSSLSISRHTVSQKSVYSLKTPRTVTKSENKKEFSFTHGKHFYSEVFDKPTRTSLNPSGERNGKSLDPRKRGKSSIHRRSEKRPILAIQYAFRTDCKVWYCLLREEVEKESGGSILRENCCSSWSTSFLTRFPSIDGLLFFCEKRMNLYSDRGGNNSGGIRPPNPVSSPSSAECILQSLFSSLTLECPLWTILFHDDPITPFSEATGETPHTNRKTHYNDASSPSRRHVVKVSGAIYEGRKVLVPPSPEQLLLLASVLPSPACHTRKEMGVEQEKEEMMNQSFVELPDTQSLHNNGSTASQRLSPVVLERIALGSFTDASLSELFSPANDITATVKKRMVQEKEDRSSSRLPSSTAGHYFTSIQALHHCFCVNPTSFFGNAFPIYAIVRGIIEDAVYPSVSSIPVSSQCDRPFSWKFPRIAIVLSQRRVVDYSPLSNSTFIENLKLYFSPWKVYEFTVPVCTHDQKPSASFAFSKQERSSGAFPNCTPSQPTTVQWHTHGGLLLLYTDEVESLLSCIHTEADIVIACGKRASAWVAAGGRDPLSVLRSSHTSHASRLSDLPRYYAVISEIEVAQQPSTHFWFVFQPSSLSLFSLSSSWKTSPVSGEQRRQSEGTLAPQLQTVAETKVLWDRVVQYVMSNPNKDNLPKVFRQAVELWIFLQSEEVRSSQKGQPVNNRCLATFAKAIALTCATTSSLLLTQIHLAHHRLG